MDFSDTVGLGDLPYDLLEASLDQIIQAFESLDPPAAVWFEVDEVTDETVHRGSIPMLGLLHLLGRNVVRVNRAWVYQRTNEGVAFVDSRELHMSLRGRDEYFLPAGISEEDLADTFSRIMGALTRADWLRITLEHFLLALDRTGLSRGVLDMTIAMESLIRSNTEVGFRFSNQIPRLVTLAPSEWEDWGVLLRDLYEVRSRHVHGALPTDRARGNVEARFLDLVELMREAIIYAIHYHSIEPVPADGWELHLNRLLNTTSPKLSPNWGVDDE